MSKRASRSSSPLTKLLPGMITNGWTSAVSSSLSIAPGRPPNLRKCPSPMMSNAFRFFAKTWYRTTLAKNWSRKGRNGPRSSRLRTRSQPIGGSPINKRRPLLRQLFICRPDSRIELTIDRRYRADCLGIQPSSLDLLKRHIFTRDVPIDDILISTIAKLHDDIVDTIGKPWIRDQNSQQVVLLPRFVHLSKHHDAVGVEKLHDALDRTLRNRCLRPRRQADP